MESAIERIYAYGAPTYSIAIVRMSSLSVVFSEVGEPQLTTTLTIGFFTRDPIGFEAGNNFYSYVGSHPLISVDPFGYDESVGGWVTNLLVAMDWMSPNSRNNPQATYTRWPLRKVPCTCQIISERNRDKYHTAEQ